MKETKSSLIGDLAHLGRGLLMGGADIIPGVSGGTVALILGIYERLVMAISHFDLTLLGHVRRRQWGRAAAHCDLRFLVALGCGILLGVGSLATLMNHLFEHHRTLTLSVFFGLILASTLLVARSIERWNVANASFAVIGAGFAFWLVGQPFVKGADGNVYLFFCGAVAICAMILPGISGAFILLILGKYEDITGVIRGLTEGNVTLDGLFTLLVFATGCAMGLLAFSKFLRWLLAHYHAPTMAVLCGFMLGSLRKIWPYKQLPASGEPLDLKHSQVPNVLPETFDGQVLASILLALAAIALVLMLDRFARRGSAP